MPELYDGCEPLDCLESLVRGAKDYVRASDDLRPRVLEAVRSQRQDRRALRYLRLVAIVVVALGVLAGALRQRLEVATTSQPGSLAAVTSALLSPAEVATQDSDVNWSMVESFTELRRRQAELLRPAAGPEGAGRKQG